MELLNDDRVGRSLDLLFDCDRASRLTELALRAIKEFGVDCSQLHNDSTRLEGLNSRIRLISHRSFGFHSADPLIALVYLCCAGITIQLPR